MNIRKTVLNKTKKNKPSSRQPWSDDELRIALEGYVYMLRLELSGVDFSVEDMGYFLAEGPLQKRNAASVRYRMRNISHVFEEKGFPILSAYSSAPRLGSGIKKRIEVILGERSNELSQTLIEREKTLSVNSKTVIENLDLLEKLVSDIENKASIGIGHNNPPEPIQDVFSGTLGVRESIQNIKIEISSSSPDKEKIEKDKNILVKFGLAIATLFVGGGLAKAGEVLLTPHILNTLESIASFVSALG